MVEGLKQLEAPPQLLPDEMGAESDHLLRIDVEEAKAHFRDEVERVGSGQTVVGLNTAFEEGDDLVHGDAGE